MTFLSVTDMYIRTYCRELNLDCGGEYRTQCHQQTPHLSEGLLVISDILVTPVGACLQPTFIHRAHEGLGPTEVGIYSGCNFITRESGHMSVFIAEWKTLR